LCAARATYVSLIIHYIQGTHVDR